MDGDDGQTSRRSRGDLSSLTDSSTSHFSYSYYERAVGEVSDGQPTSLRLLESSQLPGGQTGIHRYDNAQIASTDTPESMNTEAVLPVPSGYWSVLAVLEGRNGHSTSAWLRDNIVIAVSGALADLYSRLYEASASRDRPPTPSPGDIDQTLKDTFKCLDRDIVYGSVDRALFDPAPSAGVDMLAPAHSGSSALLSFYDSYSRNLHIALTGDSRAVLGRRTRNKDGEVVYQVRVLSVEQDSSNLAEEYRLNARHPGEAVVYNGRVLSGGPTRSFGDAMYKWDGDTRRRMQEASIGGPTPPDVKTPPYLTAEPEVTSTTVQPGDFLIMGTRGMWDRLTSEEAVGLVGMWLDEQWRQRGGSGRKHVASPNDFLVAPLVDGARSYRSEDRNVATHLLRKALNRGTGSEAIAGQGPSMTKSSVTATVVFFAEDQSP